MRRTAALAVTITLAAPATPALAQSSGYGSSPGGADSGAGPSAGSQADLPFTGMESLPIIGGGVALLLLGAGLARAGRTQEDR